MCMLFSAYFIANIISFGTQHGTQQLFFVRLTSTRTLTMLTALCLCVCVLDCDSVLISQILVVQEEQLVRQHVDPVSSDS